MVKAEKSTINYGERQAQLVGHKWWRIGERILIKEALA